MASKSENKIKSLILQVVKEDESEYLVYNMSVLAEVMLSLRDRIKKLEIEIEGSKFFEKDTTRYEKQLERWCKIYKDVLTWMKKEDKKQRDLAEKTFKVDPDTEFLTKLAR